ncbi:MAG: PAS domain S-box protein, partial [Anaerolineae bacterium]|nr:PAS domain S-box protein [Anaerolineae bacterium]
IHPDDLSYVIERQQAVLAPDAPPESITFRARHKDNHYIWLETTGKVLWSEDQKDLLGFIMVSRDVTERKRAEEAIRNSEALLRTVLELLPVGVWVTDENGLITLGNPSGEQIWAGAQYVGPESYGVYKAWWLETGKPVEPEEWAVARAITKGETSLNEELEIECFDGTRKIITNSAVPLRDSEQNIIGAIIVNQDITERKQAAETLRGQRDFLQLVIDTVPDIIVVKDQHGRFQLVNKAAAKIYGSTTAELVGKTDTDFNPHSDETRNFAQADQKALAQGQPLFIPEERVMGRHYRTNKIPLQNPAGDYDRLLVVASDITSFKEAEQSLKENLEKEKELGELKSRFVSMTSHEFRTPLASILAVTETLRAYWQKLSANQIDERLAKIQDQVARLEVMMEDVLQLARVQARRVQFQPVALDLDAFCRNIIDEFESRPDITNPLIYTCNRTLPQAELDERLMHQIINNLISNAVKYSPSNHPIGITLDYADNTLMIKVSDQGIGISEADLKHLFKPFHRGTNVGTVSGTGLGLVIAQEAVELHDGLIMVESRLDHGTTFTVSIPINNRRESNDDENTGH